MLQCNNLTLYRGIKKICDRLSFAINKGTCIGIEGNNGCGKSTLMECLTGLRKPDSGEILLDGYSIHHLTSQGKKQFFNLTGIVLQETGLRPYDRLEKILSLFSNFSTSIFSFLSQTGLEHSSQRFIKDLSFGQRRILDLLQSLAKNPKLIFWDEPFLSLDASVQNFFKTLLLERKQNGVTIIISTVSLSHFQFLNFEKKITL